jgi:carboxylate-amine ligase
MGSEQRFREVVDGLVRSGVVQDGGHLYWDVRPSARWPTLEFRLADVCTDLDAAVLQAALVRDGAAGAG